MADISKDLQVVFSSAKLKAFINLKYTASYLSNKENTFFKQYDISPQQYNILRILKGADAKMRVQDVKHRMVERAPNATRLMDKLFKKDLIDRMRSEKDRRGVFVSINSNGIALLERVAVALDFSFVDALTEAEANTLSDLLDKIRD